MTDPRPVLPFDNDTELASNCRAQHQQWANVLNQHEREINQLVGMLTDLLAQHNTPTLRHRAVQYVTRLNQLRSRFQRLRLDMTCSGVSCSPTDQPICAEPYYGFYTSLDMRIRRVSDELGLLSTGCYQFLSVLVSLNLL